jgi:long-chain acyl-CoA synthetase
MSTDVFDSRVRDTFRAHADRVCLIDGRDGRTLSYRDLLRLALAFRAELTGRGLQRGDRVALILPNSLELATAYFGCLLGGFVAVPINPLFGRRDLRYALEAARVRLLLTAPETAAVANADDAVPADLARLTVLRPDQAGDIHAAWSFAYAAPAAHTAPAPDESITLRDDDLFAITFTSGTTARPKGVCHTVRSLLASALAFNHVNEIGPDHRYYHVLNMTYMAGFLNTLLCPFLAGASVVIDDPFGPQTALRFWQLPMRYEVNTLWLVPTICAALVRLDRSQPGRTYAQRAIRLACVGTAPLPRSLQEQFESKYGVPLLESYGLSEILFVSANVPSLPRKIGGVGRPLPGVEVRVETGAAVGELSVRTPFAMKNYLDPDTGMPSASPAEPWFSTGDIGEIDGDGYVFIRDRKKDLVIRGGINISPRSVEELLLQQPAVDEAAVVGVPHEFYGEDLVAVVKLKQGHALEAEKPRWDALCRAELGAHAIPGRCFAIDELPKNANGKINKVELRAWIQAQK